MMSSNNNNGDVGMAVGLVVAGLACLALMAFFAAAFIAFVMTVLALFAWNRPLRIGRKFVITPEEARGFVKRGLAGMGLVPFFFVLLDVLLGVTIEWDFLPYMALFGYVAGSLGIEVLMAEMDDAVPDQAWPQEQRPALPEPETRPVAEKPAPFRYATWDDEEEQA
ncbi:hypothetical protein [Nitratireductor sp. StC3]|uniref:hypothetical protein n=1 Tax=Nitratireductor sp. StC3 TaxID=2126741 RepID=UPI000D0CB5FB|nr:hypothetical protein [Nitratireductor sp. StC3]PSM16693.1 hypothetical protein C7T96_18630 [Nitratireductor sp. StC3]